MLMITRRTIINYTHGGAKPKSKEKRGNAKVTSSYVETKE